MNRADLDRMNREAIQRHYRTIEDHDGRIPQALLDDLAIIAGHHVITQAAEAVERPARARKTRNPGGTAE